MAVDDPIWHPNGTRVTPKGSGGIPSDRRRRRDPSKLTVHTLETPKGTGRSVASRLPFPYSVVADPYTREIFNVLPLNWTAWSLRGTHAGTGAKIETNHSGRMHPQLALVGYAADMDELDLDQLEWLALEVIKPILDLCDIPNEWAASYGPEHGAIASVNSPTRMSQSACWEFNGVLYHQRWHGQDHWDAGRLNGFLIRDLIAGRVVELPGSRNTDVPKRTLGVGDEGKDVRWVQELLNEWFDAGLTVDGKYGPATRRAVRKMQAEVGAPVDGWFGELTRHLFRVWKRGVAEVVAVGGPTIDLSGLVLPEPPIDVPDRAGGSDGQVLPDEPPAAPPPPPVPAPSPDPVPSPVEGAGDALLYDLIDKLGAQLSDLVGVTDDIKDYLRSRSSG